MITLRASSLDDAADCPRRHALRMFREIQERYPPRALYPAIGSLVGTAVHHAVTALWRGRTMAAALDGAHADFAASAAAGMTLDAATPDRSTALQQISRALATYQRAVMPRITSPVQVELTLTARISPDLILRGIVDLVTRDGTLRDLKDEIRGRPHLNQLGAYALLLRSHGRKILLAVIDHIKRQSPRALRTQPPHYQEIVYPVATAEASAHDTIMRTAASLIEYRQREADKDPRPWLAFRANPSSMTCSAKYCPAYGTQWCVEGAAAHGETK